MRRILIHVRFVLASCLLVAGSVQAFGAPNQTKPNPAATDDQPESGPSEKRLAKDKSLEQTNQEQAFQKALSGATLIGHFVDTGAKSSDKFREEKYSILSVKKVKPNQWEFRSRIQYGEHDITVPLTLPVYWAGDTPVITLDKIPVPGLGTFTARVMIFDDHYAGTWNGGDHGGVMFGRIERETDQDEPKKP